MTLSELQKSNYSCPGQLDLWGLVEVSETVGGSPENHLKIERRTPMKVKLNGNVASIVTEIKYDDLCKATATNPIYIKNAEGKKVYGIDTGTVGTISNVGVTFSYKNADGFAALNVCFDPKLTQDEVKEVILTELAAPLEKLTTFEEVATEIIADRAEARAALEATIEIG